MTRRHCHAMCKVIRLLQHSLCTLQHYWLVSAAKKSIRSSRVKDYLDQLKVDIFALQVCHSNDCLDTDLCHLAFVSAHTACAWGKAFQCLARSETTLDSRMFMIDSNETSDRENALKHLTENTSKQIVWKCRVIDLGNNAVRRRFLHLG